MCREKWRLNTQPMYKMLFKRVLDVFLASVSLIVFLPFFIIIAIAIKLDSEGPVFFIQKRAGVNSKLFNIYKFRSMKIDTPELATDKLDNHDKYVTRVGKILRKTSLDELPQLINILKGDMSFVGPRPALYNQYELIEMRRNLGIDKVKPGLTGYAQVIGRDFISDERKVELDKFYVENLSLWLDLKIMYWTIFKVFKAENVKG